MARRELTYEDLLRIAEVMRTASHFSEFRLKVGDIEVSVRRSNGGAGGAGAGTAHSLPAPVASAREASGKKVLSKTEIPEGTAAVRAPMVGTFYRAPSPGAPPFVEAGGKVEPGTVVGIIEVMKLMNQIEAGTRGVVREVLVGNAEPVEHGQALILIDPA